MVAGIIAGQPGTDGFSKGGAGGWLISLRQTSARFAPVAPEDPALTRCRRGHRRTGGPSYAPRISAPASSTSRCHLPPVTTTIDQNWGRAALRGGRQGRRHRRRGRQTPEPIGLAGGAAACQSNPQAWAGSRRCRCRPGGSPTSFPSARSAATGGRPRSPWRVRGWDWPHRAPT